MKLKRHVKLIIISILFLFITGNLIYTYSKLSILNNTIEEQKILIKELNQKNDTLVGQLNDIEMSLENVSNEIQDIKN